MFELAEEDCQTVEFIKNYLPQELKDKFTDELLFYMHDVMVDYFYESGILDQEPDDEGFIDVDTEAVANVILEQVRKDKMGDFTLDEVMWVVQGELEFGE